MKRLLLHAALLAAVAGGAGGVVKVTVFTLC
jgi:hypothetical protein